MSLCVALADSRSFDHFKQRISLLRDWVNLLRVCFYFFDTITSLGDLQNLQERFLLTDTTRQPRPGEVNGKGECVAVGSVSSDSGNNSSEKLIRSFYVKCMHESPLADKFALHLCL